MADSNAHFLLSRLHNGASWAYLWTNWSARTDGHGTSLWYRVNDGMPDLPEHWQNVYFSVHGCLSAGTPEQRSGAGGARLATANCLYADFDRKTMGWTHVCDLWPYLDRLEGLGVPYPSVVVYTGGGYHGYWLLDAPVDLTDPDQRARIDQAQRIWVDEVVRADGAAKDLSRVLRLPGTLNHKYFVPKNVAIVEDNDTRYTLTDLEKLTNAFAQARQVQAKPKYEAPPGSVSWDKLVQWAHANANTGSRHGIALWLAHRLAENKCPRITALSLIESFFSANVTDRDTRGEAAGIIKHAYA